MNAPRELDINFFNPIEGAKFTRYMLRAKQEFHTTGKQTKYVDNARNVDPMNITGSDLRVGPLFYSIYGVYSKFMAYHGLYNCIGDFKTLNQALLVLEGIGVIDKQDRGHIIAQALSGEMENVR
jgi:hypothetical protein